MIREIDKLIEAMDRTKLETGMLLPELSPDHIVLLLVTLCYDKRAQRAWAKLRRHMGIVHSEILRKARELFLLQHPVKKPDID